MIRFLLLLLLVPSLCFGDSDTTIGGKTADGHIIQNNGTSLRPRPYLNFTTGMTCTDTGGKTVCASSGGGGGTGGVNSSSTLGLVPTYVGSSTVGPSTNVYIIGNNLGVGSATPGQVLDVAGNIRASGTITTTNNVGIGTSLTTTAGLSVMSGNVGIGTWKPQAMLDVTGSVAVGTVNAAAKLEVQQTGNTNVLNLVQANENPFAMAIYNRTFSATNSIFSFFPRNTGYFEMGTDQAQDLQLYTNSYTNPRLTISSAGNVGIGSVTPGQILDVQGNVRASGTLGGSNFSGTSSGTNTGDQTNIAGNAATVTTNANLTGSDVTSSGNAATLSSTWKGWSYTSPVVSLSTITDSVGIGTTLARNGLSVMSGNIGIGTWTPQNSLIVATGNVGIGTAFPGQSLDVNGNVRIRGTSSVTWADDAKLSILASATTTPDMRFLANSTEVMRISNGNNVGIGTTVMVGKFIVSGGNVGIGTGIPEATLKVKGSADQVQLQVQGNGTQTNNLFNFTNSAATSEASLTNAGALTIASSLTTGGSNTQSTYTSGVLVNSSKVTSANGGDFQVNTNVGIGTFFISATTGNIGIGTPNPGVALDLAGGRFRTVGIGTTVPCPKCIKADGTDGYYNTPTWTGTCL